VILQASLSMGHFPKPFKHTTTVVLRKPQKPDYTKAKAYRPIALESTIGKVCESIVAETLSYLAETYQLLPNTHFGGRPGRSTVDAMAILMEQIHKAWREQKVFTAVFLDVAGAFNNVHHKRLMHNLKMRKVPKLIVDWVGNFLKGRSTQMQFNGARSGAMPTPAGLPQGSPLSPILYMFYNADLLEITESPNKMAMGFIDDITYGAAGYTDRENVKELKNALERADKWKEKHGAQFEESKYVMVHFTRNRRDTIKASLKTATTKIRAAAEARYLGVTFDRELRFRTQMENAVKTGTKAALALSRIGKSTWGASYECLRRLYQATVASRIDYGALIWHRPNAKGNAESSASMRKFSTIQRIAMKATLGCYRTAPTAAMEVESGLQPPWIRLQTKVLKAAVRLQSLAPTHPIKRWIQRCKREIRKAGTRKTRKLVHCSPIESLMTQFPEIAGVQLLETTPSTRPPWAEAAAPEDHNAAGTPSADNPLTRQTMSKQITALARKTWLEKWVNPLPNKSTAKHLRGILPAEVTAEAMAQGPKIYRAIGARPKCALMAQLRTGHCGLNHYLWRFKKSESAECEYCGDSRETIEHFILDCPAHWEARKKIRGKMGTGNMTLAAILGSECSADMVAEYAANTGRYVKGEWKGRQSTEGDV
jgi:hypothetical protein